MALSACGEFHGVLAARKSVGTPRENVRTHRTLLFRSVTTPLRRKTCVRIGGFFFTFARFIECRLAFDGLSSDSFSELWLFNALTNCFRYYIAWVHTCDAAV